MLFFLSKLPLKLSHFLGYIIGIFAYYSNSKSRQSITTNVNLCLTELTKKQRSKIIKKNIINLTKSLLEAPIIWGNNASKNNKLIKNIQGLEHLSENDNVIMLIPHIGAWELLGRFASYIRHTTALYKPLRNKKFDELLLQARQTDNYNLVNTRFSGVAKLQKALRNKDIICILPDQVPENNKSSVVVDFFNIPTPTATILVKLARKYNSKIILSYAKRLDYGKGFNLYFKEIDILSKDNDITNDCLLMNQNIENLVKKNPEQYLWQYKRFKTLQK